MRYFKMKHGQNGIKLNITVTPRSKTQHLLARVCVYSRRNSFCVDESSPESLLLHLPAISGSKSPLLPLIHSHPLGFKGSPFLILSGTLHTDSLKHSNIYATHKCYRSPNLTACHLRSCWRGSKGVLVDSFLPAAQLTLSTWAACTVCIRRQRVLEVSLVDYLPVNVQIGVRIIHVLMFSSWGEWEWQFIINVK